MILKYQGDLQCRCGHVQEVRIFKSSNPIKGGIGRKGAVSSQVSCEKCLAYIKHEA